MQDDYKDIDWRNLSPEEEDSLVEAAFQEVLQAYLSSNHRKKAEVIERAFRFAKEAHKGVRRRSGEPYILHPVAVAKIVISELGLGSTSICAAFLHDVVEDTEYTREDIEAHFGPTVASLVEGLTKISGGIFNAQSSLQAENFRKLLLSMSTDVRVVLIKMADRLHNMRTLGSMRPEKQYKIAGETLYVYAPLAHRLGLHKIKTELEDLAFRYEHPAKYEEIKHKILSTEEEREKMVEEFIAPIRRKMDQAGFKYEIKTRVKSVYSIWNKMEQKKVGFDEIYDVYAVRVIFDNDDDTQEKLKCYQIYTFFTDDGHRLHPERTRDWISSPKPNGYRALHLTSMGPRGKWVEVQIRSRKMDEIAELGYAAHWKYKEGINEETELDSWMNTIKDILAHPEPNALDFLDTIKLNLFSSNIYVFTPKGDLKTLPKGATVLDLAFAIHSELGMHCIAGKVNHKLVQMSHPLESGDQVEIITSDSQTPQPEWLEYAKTARALNRIGKALRENRNQLLLKGAEIFKDHMEKHHLKPHKALVKNILQYYHLPSLDDLYLMLGRDEINFNAEQFSEKEKSRTSFVGKLLRNPFASKKPDQDAKEDKEGKERPAVNRKETFVLYPDAEKPNYRLDDCCRPLPGDDVLGFVDDNEEVVVHQVSCPNAMKYKATYGSRLVATKWGGAAKTFMATVEIEGLDRRGMLEDIIHLLSTVMDVNIRGLNIEADKEVFHCTLQVKIDNADTVAAICKRLKTVDGVQIARRVS